MAESYPNRLKTLREKEKLLVTSNFSFPQSVFKRLILQTCKNQGLFGKGLRFNQFGCGFMQIVFLAIFYNSPLLVRMVVRALKENCVITGCDMTLAVKMSINSKANKQGKVPIL